MKNRNLFDNKRLSLAARAITVVLVLASTAVTGALSLQTIYQGEVDRYFEKEQGSELMLIIQSGHHTLKTTGSGKDNFRPLLSSELGQYQDHTFVGWHADFKQMTRGGGLPFLMLYEVSYKKGRTQEFFSYEGLLNPKLIAREVHIN
ncbi:MULTISPECIES: hypothetical protein [unclassified Endozoicomonas]|uniref:hypothetical protein n=1 Tax=unclassified Endozoicomonas TaxID=2644528 RepID=UPI002148F5C3|nr:MULTISPECIES: hypothetical protein [unclassified Endozoicomonas]